MSPDWDGAADGSTDDRIELFSQMNTPLTFTVNSGTLLTHQEVGMPDYPTYGQFVQAVDDGQTVYVEAPHVLRQFFDLENVTAGDTVRITEVWKADGRWAMKATVLNDGR